MIKSITFFVTLIAIRLSLDVAYIYFVHPNYEYAGFDLSFKVSKYSFSWLCFILSFGLVRQKISNPSNVFFLIATCILVAPTSSLYALSTKPVLPLLATIASLYITHIICYQKINTLIEHSRLKNSRRILTISFLLMIAATCIWYIFSGAVKNINFDITKVYNYRDINTELTQIGILAYFINWTYSIANTSLLAICLYKKSYFSAFAVLAVQLYLFGVSAHKSVLLMPFLVICIWILYRNNNDSRKLALAFLATILLTLLVFFYTNNPLLPSFLVRRTFFIAGTLTFDYFIFFSENPHTYWSNGVLSSLIDYPYTQSIPSLIGEFNGSGSRANNGYISSGYAHAGMFGVLLYSIAMGFILKLIDNITKRSLPIWLSTSITIIPLYRALLSSDLFTSLLTHGLFLSLIAVYLYRQRPKCPVNLQ